jgi:diacylglycerol kinase family enzyme
MESGEKQTNLNIYVVINPAAGNSSASEIRQSLDEQLGEKHYTYQVHETTGEEDLT